MHPLEPPPPHAIRSAALASPSVLAAHSLVGTTSSLLKHLQHLPSCAPNGAKMYLSYGRSERKAPACRVFPDQSEQAGFSLITSSPDFFATCPLSAPSVPGRRATEPRADGVLRGQPYTS